jgi:hypothetical protein
MPDTALGRSVKHLARMDHRAFLEESLLNDAIHLRTDLRRQICRYPSRQLSGQLQRLGLQL